MRKTFDGGITPLAHVTTCEAMSVVLQIASKLAPADAVLLTEGVTRLAGGRFEAPITGPRWLDLWLAADMATWASGDLHHLLSKRFDLDAGHPAELHLLAGS